MTRIKRSAGLLMYRLTHDPEKLQTFRTRSCAELEIIPSVVGSTLEVGVRQSAPEFLLVHPGGPYWMKRDAGAWSIPKGLYEDEEPLVAAKREFEEETGCRPEGDFIELGDFKQPGGKIISAWAFEGDFDLGSFRSNLFAMEWPPRSKRFAEFPEADRAGWFNPADAFRKISRGQAPIIDALLVRLRLDPK